MDKLKRQIYLLSGECKKEAEYWINKLSGELEVNNFPYDYIAAADLGENAIRFDLPVNIGSKLIGICKGSDNSLFCILLSAAMLLLYKYTDKTDVLIGSTICKQQSKDNLINSILIYRSMLDKNVSFKEFLLNVRGVIKEAEANQNIPLDILIEGEYILYADNIKDIFKTAVILENIHDETYLHNTEPDLLISFKRNDSLLSLTIKYCRSLYLEGTIQRIGEHLINLLNIISGNIDIAIKEIDVLSGMEKQQLLFDFNDTKADYPSKTIHQLFEEQAARTPDNIAVIYEDKQLTYEQLNKKANQLARVLKSMGVEREELVGIYSERSLEIIIGMLAVLKAGGAYLPIDTIYPRDRVSFMLKDSGARIVLCKDAKGEAKLFDQEALTIISIEDENIYIGDATNLTSVNTPQDLAYVIYTSGTTGIPKGALLEHRNVARLMINSKTKFDFNSHDVWTMFHSMSFDFSVWEMYGALLYGGRLIIVPRLIAQETAEFVKLLKRERVTVLNQTPTAFANIIKEELISPEKELSIRYVIFGGEALKPAMLKEWRSKYPEAKLINMYGITETTVHVTYKEITEVEIAADSSNIGRPIPTLTTYIMDKNLKLLPLGAAGELCVGGDGVCRGYLNRPKLTADKFAENPYVKGDRLYRSGDLAKFLPNGEMEYLGRIDHQVKIRGHRIELGEIESKLLGYPSITGAVVLKKEDNGEAYLSAYITVDKQLQDEITISSIREYLLKALPVYMLPSSYNIIHKMPITQNGKIDRRLLENSSREALKAYNIVTGTEYEPPRNKLEEELIYLWQEVLGVEKIGINDNFFVLGGHSFKIIRLVELMHKRLQIEVQFWQIFNMPTIKKLSEAILKKNISNEENEDIYLLNKKTQNNIFVLPPGVGYSMTYRNLAKQIESHSFYAADFIEHKNRIAEYIKLIKKVQSSGSYTFFGYSAGGTLAYDIAMNMSFQGDKIKQLMVIDSAIEYAKLENLDKDLEYNNRTLEDIAEEFIKELGYNKFMEQYRNIERAKEKVVKKMRVYNDYLENFIKYENKLEADVHLILCDTKGRTETDDYIINTWKNSISGNLVVHRGVGQHGEMLDPKYFNNNLDLIRSILYESL